MIKTLRLFFIFFSGLTCTVYAQYNDLIFRHLSSSDGLSQNSVIAIAQDKMGLIWFGTRDGLNKYDGEEFLVYKHDNNDSTSISNNDITSIITDSAGDLWIGTFNGLNKYNYSTGQFQHFFNDAGDSTTLSDNSIWTIAKTVSGDIWVGTANGLNRYDKDTHTFERFYHDPENEYSLSNDYIVDIFEDSEGSLWIGTADGLNKMVTAADGKERFIRYYHKAGDASSLSDSYVQTIAEDRYGNLWIGTRHGGLNKYDKITNTFEAYKFNPGNSSSISNNDVRCLSFDNAGRLWVGTYSGLNLFDSNTERFYRYLNDKNHRGTLSKNSIKSMLIDVKGSLWVGTYYGGVNFLDPQNSNFKNYKLHPGSNISFDVISAIIEDEEGNVYVGTEGGGINILNRRTGEFSYIKRDNTDNTISSNNIKSLYLDNKENLWIGTFNGGLNILNLKSGTIRHYQNDLEDASSVSDNDIYSIVKQNDSLFWLGTHGGGLNLFNRYTGHFLHFREGTTAAHLTSDLIRIVFKDSAGNLWIGTQFGLNFLSYKDILAGNIRFKRYFYDNKKKYGENISTVFEDSQSRIWVGTSESGLNLFDPRADKFLNFGLNTLSGSLSNVVHGMLEDNNQHLWISTNQGILKLDPRDSTFKMFDESDGLVGNEFNNNSCMKAASGLMYFGSLQGLTTFHPDSIISNQYAPPIVLTDFKLFGRSVKAGDSQGVLDKVISQTRELTLDYDQAIFTIEFALPNYINPGKNRYAYRLKGLEEQWNVAGNSSATYTIQKSGTYLFEVKGANNDGLWTSRATTLKITVNPAPWRTWWAFLLYSIVISIALYVLVNIILSRSKFKHELELEHLKLQFFTNISHEFRTPLVLILGPLEQIIASYTGSNKLYKQLLVIEKNASSLLKLINQLMDFRKFENNHFHLMAAEGNIVDFVKEIYLSFKQYAKLHHFDYKFTSEADTVLLWFDRDKMERVIFNLISNAFKYTSDYGKIGVSVSLQEDHVTIRVVDSGVGMEPDHLPKIFERYYEVDDKSPMHSKYHEGTGIGLALAKGIVDLHSGHIHVESRKDEGSAFTVRLPLGNAHLKATEIINDFKNSEDIASYQEKSYYVEEQSKGKDFVPEAIKDAPLILVVEDNEEVRKYIVGLFNDSCNVKEARNGQEGLQQAQLSVPDIIISDVMMPVMDGIEFCSQIKSNIRTSHIPFILLTARTSLVFKFEGLEKGADDYINKPFLVKELKIKVKNLINTQKKLKEKFANESVIKPSEITVNSIDEKLFEKALRIVDENISNELFDISAFCEELGVSRTVLFTKIKAWTNLTPNEFIQVMRLKRAASLLEQNKLTIAQVGFKVGFKNPKYFSKCFQRHYSVNPVTYAKKFTCAAEPHPEKIEN